MSKSLTSYNDIKITVIMGGISSERQVSIQSGQCIHQALKQAGINTKILDIRPDNLHLLDTEQADVYFIAQHGRFGEDGQLQQILEDKGLVYTGSGPAASKLAFDKILSKQRFLDASIPVPKAIRFDPTTDKEQIKQLGDSYVIKPIRQGSSVGISIVHNLENAIVAADQTYQQYGNCMIEQFIKGREITVGILNGRTLPIIEIRSKTNFYDYHAKYVDDNTEYLFDTIDDIEVIEKTNDTALVAFNALDCRDFSRVDFILADDGVAYVLEVNTIPGFTTHSLLPKAAAKIGLGMDKLCLQIIDSALNRADKKIKRQAVRLSQ
jgi:D-alanine-D-alanine ligase